MNALKTTARRILSDLRHLRNIDAYVVTVVALLLAVLGVLDDAVSQDLKLAVILAALGLLVFNLTVPDRVAADLDEVLRDRSEFGAFAEVIDGARTLWLFAPSAVNVLTTSSVDIKHHILDKPGGEFRLILQDPLKSEALAITTQQIDASVQYALHQLPDAIRQSQALVEKMRGWTSAGTVEHRFFPYSPGFSLVIIDPDKPTGRVIVEFHGIHHEQITNRMHVVIARAQSQYWFEYWVRQFEYMWDTARPADTPSMSSSKPAAPHPETP